MTLPVPPLPETDLADAASFIDAAAHILALNIDPAHRDTVVQNFAVLMGHASLVLAFPLGTTIEVAPMFRA